MCGKEMQMMPRSRVPLKDMVVIADKRFLVAKWLVAVDDGLRLIEVLGAIVG